ncbi:MAG: hypothetical protein ACTHMA_16565 [Thermomicrobiales bacterium]
MTAPATRWGELLEAALTQAKARRGIADDTGLDTATHAAPAAQDAAAGQRVQEHDH